MYSIGACGSSSAAKQLITKSHQQQDKIPSNYSTDISLNKLGCTPSQEEIESNYRDGVCNDISELFGFFDSNLKTLSSNETITTQSATSPGRQLNMKNNDIVNDSQNNKRYKSMAGDNVATSSNNGNQIIMKSSETFPLSNALKDVILDLDIGKTVRITRAL